MEQKARHTWRPWKVEKVRSTCPYCGVGCQQWLHVQEGRIVKVTGVEEAQPNQGRLCVKGRFGYDFIFRDSNANWLTNDVFDGITMTAEYKACAVRIDKL